MTTTAWTSRDAYQTIYSKIGDKQRQVFEAIEELGVASNEEIADHLNWPINCVTGRVTELRKYGFVGLEDIKKSKAGMKVKAWSVRSKSDNLLMDLIDECGA